VGVGAVQAARDLESHAACIVDSACKFREPSRRRLQRMVDYRLSKRGQNHNSSESSAGSFP